MQLARATAAQSLAEAATADPLRQPGPTVEAEPADPGILFTRLVRAVCGCITLEARLATNGVDNAGRTRILPEAFIGMSPDPNQPTRRNPRQNWLPKRKGLPAGNPFRKKNDIN